MSLPRYDELPITPGAPSRSSWGLWGAADVFGCLNLLGAEQVLAGVRSVRAGKVFPLNWKMELPDPPLFGRSRTTHRVLTTDDWHDDVLDRWNTQSSSQWDGFRHVRSATRGYYGGVPDGDHGIHHWARRGIVGRGVLVDVGRWREAAGQPLVMSDSDPITVGELAEVLKSLPVSIEPGDVLLLRTGWTEWYERHGDSSLRRRLAEGLRAPGLEPSEDLLRLLWDLHIAAIAADNPAVERCGVHGAVPDETTPPEQATELFGHLALLPLLGLPLGELFDLSALATDCAEDGIYDGLFTSAPLNLKNGVASPPNALFVK